MSGVKRTIVATITKKSHGLLAKSYEKPILLLGKIFFTEEG